MIDYKTFYAYARKAPFGGSLTTQQVLTCDAILNYWFDKHASKPLELLAYILATPFHETATIMLPVKETVMPYHVNKNPSDQTVINRLDKSFAAGKLKGVSKPYWRKQANGWAYFGRGLPQLTHEANYKKFGLANTPGKALELETSVRVLIEGMLSASFGGKPLIQYYNPAMQEFDAVGARATVNGTDKAKLIAGYYQNFLDALKAARKAREVGKMPADVVAADATPDDVPASQSGNAYALPGIPALGAGALAAVNGVNNLYSLLTILGLGALALFTLWLLSTGRITFNRVKK